MTLTVTAALGTITPASMAQTPSVAPFLGPHIRLIIAILLFLIGIGVSALYVVDIVQRTVAYYRGQFGFKTARYCNWKSCGYYEHSESDPFFRECANEKVSDEEFEERSQTGMKPGCNVSMRLREPPENRSSAQMYVDLYAQAKRDNDVLSQWWKIGIVLVLLSLITLGLLTLGEVIHLPW